MTDRPFAGLPHSDLHMITMDVERIVTLLLDTMSGVDRAVYPDVWNMHHDRYLAQADLLRRLRDESILRARGEPRRHDKCIRCDVTLPAELIHYCTSCERDLKVFV